MIQPSSSTAPAVSKETSRVKKDYSAALPRVASSSYLSPLHIQVDSLYSLHRPLLMSELNEELLPLNAALFERSWAANPSSFKVRSDDKKEKEMIARGKEGRREVVVDVIMNGDAIGEFASGGTQSLDLSKLKEKYSIYEVEEEEGGSGLGRFGSGVGEKGWQRTPFCMSAVGLHDFKEWDGDAVGKLIGAVNGRILPFQKPKADEFVVVVNESKKKSKVGAASSLFQVEKLVSNPAQKLIKKTRGRIRPRPVMFKRKKE